MYKESADGFLAELKAECEALYGKNAGDTEYNDRVSTDPAIEHAEKLHSQGKVYGDEQWKNLNVLSSMSDLLPRQALAMHGTTDALAAVNEEVSGRLRPLAEKIDAFRQNPNATLAGLPNCVVMPHSSAFSPRYLERCFDELHAAGLLA